MDRLSWSDLPRIAPAVAAAADLRLRLQPVKKAVGGRSPKTELGGAMPAADTSRRWRQPYVAVTDATLAARLAPAHIIIKV